LNEKYRFFGISGTGRSGTNVTKELLSRHSSVASLHFESRFIIDPDCVVQTYRSLIQENSPYQVSCILKRFFKKLEELSRKNRYHYFWSLSKYLGLNPRFLTPPPYFDWELNKYFQNFDKHANNLINQLSIIRYDGVWPGEKGLEVNNKIYFLAKINKKELQNYFNIFITNLYSEYLKKNSKEVFIEDNTWDLIYAKEILELIPSYKFINVIRDPRDTIASMIKQRWAPHKVIDAIQFYKSIVNSIEKNIAMIPKDNILTIQYENLISSPNVIINKILNFMNLKYEELYPESLLHSESIGRWKSELNKEDIKGINYQLGSYIKKLGYE
jgi:hypothetical protein